MTKTAAQMWGAALSLSPSYLMDKFLDWLEELSGAMVPAQVGEFVNCAVRTEAMGDPFSA